MVHHFDSVRHGTDSGQLVMDPEGLGSADLSIPSASSYQATANRLRLHSRGVGNYNKDTFTEKQCYYSTASYVSAFQSNESDEFCRM